MSTLLASHTFIAGIVLLLKVLDLLARLNAFMGRKAINLPSLPGFLDNVFEQLESLRKEDGSWHSDVRFLIADLEKEYNIRISMRAGVTRRAVGIGEYKKKATVPYPSALIINIRCSFSNKVVKLLVSSSVFFPSQFPTLKKDLPGYSYEEKQTLSTFYGHQAVVEHRRASYTSSPYWMLRI